MEASALTRFRMLKEKYASMLNDALAQNKVDSMLIPFLQKVNALEDYFTASSCAGRIILLETSHDENKKTSKFIFKEHRKVKFREIYEHIKNWYASNKLLWFKQEPFILHIGAATLENAQKIIAAMRNAGVKRGGIMVAQPGKFIVELLGTQNLAFLAKSEDFEICEKCLRNQIRIANKKLQKNYSRLKRFEREFLKVARSG